jgi:hypothetical protein
MSGQGEPKLCSKCQTAPVGLGGILCPPCKRAIEAVPPLGR